MSARGLSRRRVLTILAASAALPVGIAGLRMFGPQPTFHDWQGEALGAQASMRLWHANGDHARRTLARMTAEVQRLENIFSLYRAESELSRLNRDGVLQGASPALRDVLDYALALAVASNGAFDPSVQPLWTLYERHFSRPDASPAGPAALERDHARGLVDYRAIDLAGRNLRLGTPGMALTLNGIAQGYVTDVIADLLRNEGFDHAVVAMGETRVLGTHPEGQPWRVGLRDSSGHVGRVLELANQASATSGGYGTVFDPSGQHHHIFDPATGGSAHRLTEAVVTAPRAMVADALATALVVAGADRAPAILASVPGARAILTRPNGETVML